MVPTLLKWMIWGGFPIIFGSTPTFGPSTHTLPHPNWEGIFVIAVMIRCLVSLPKKQKRCLLWWHKATWRPGKEAENKTMTMTTTTLRPTTPIFRREHMTRTTMTTTTQTRTKASLYVPFLSLRTCENSRPFRNSETQHGPFRTCFNPSHVLGFHPWNTTWYHHVCCISSHGPLRSSISWKMMRILPKISRQIQVEDNESQWQKTTHTNLRDQ